MGIRNLQDGSLLLLIPLRLPDPTFEVLDARQVRPVLAGFASLGARLKLPVRLLEAPGAGRVHVSPGELQLRGDFLSLFGPGALPLPGSLENSPLLAALRMSTHYMGEGFREAAVEMFSSPLFLISVGLSVLLYFSAWLAPEPLFSKAFAATLTARLALVFGVAELARVAKTCLLLYEDVEAARTPQELEAASKRFGTTIGGTGLRVLVMVASMGVARIAPEIPEGGLQALAQGWRVAGPGGPAAELVGQAKIVADGTVLVTGAAAGMSAAGACGALGLCATAAGPSGGAQLSTRYGPPHTRKNPPHNEAIEEDLAARENAGHTDLRKNKAQVNATRNRVSDREPVNGVRFRRPDASSVRLDGVRHNVNYVSVPPALEWVQLDRSGGPCRLGARSTPTSIDTSLALPRRKPWPAWS